jgi:cyclopropane-fatty-acyl-phospholipid synthase
MGKGIGSKLVKDIRHPLWRGLINKLAQSGVSQITLILPNQDKITVGEINEDISVPSVHLVRLSVLRKAIFSGLVGWGEAYVDGDWTTPDLIQVTEWAMHNSTALEKAFSGSNGGRWFHRLLHRLNDNTLKGSRRNISAHYDLGNDFYRLWLDKSMTYSSALYYQPEDDLQQAQKQKYDRILELLKPDSHSRVLEIGCGWGGFAERLIQKYPEADYHGVTLSQEQLDWTRNRLSQQNLDKKAAATLTDYREVTGQYDRIASIEMLEAVGEKHWDTYFKSLYKQLAPGGRAVLQVITIAPERFESYRNNADFIQRYIFPGGMLLTPDIVQQQAQQAGLNLSYSQAFGQNYASTLQRWRRNFELSWPKICQQGFDEHFRRLWLYYLCYCESGFRHNSIDVYLFQLEKPTSASPYSEQNTGTAL